MKIYKVGGCVRDFLMGVPERDVDWLVVGATPYQMAELGYQQVGADFPVFLHPTTHEEYALARKERKTGLGHKGFQTTFDPSVTLEEDLSRRDLTINAMAMDPETGYIHDPFGGLQDLAASVLRHVSAAFAEDPLRVMRLARFQARTGFSIHPSTFELGQEICARGDLHQLSTERVCSELRKLLDARLPDRGLATLLSIGALRSLDPSWPARLGEFQLAALAEASGSGLPEWALVRLARCQGLDAKGSASALEALKFPNDIARWCSRSGELVGWALRAPLDEPIDFEAACSALERCGAPKFRDFEHGAFAACVDLELAGAGAEPARRALVARALVCSGAIASADLSEALLLPKSERPCAVRRAKVAALADQWRRLDVAPAAVRPRI